jgi:hypothetical protein
MLLPAPPMSNTERQRQFRLRNPGYYNKYNARRSAIYKGAKARIEAMAAADAAAAPAPAPLALPAPAVVPVLPGLNAIRATPAPVPIAA